MHIAYLRFNIHVTYIMIWVLTVNLLPELSPRPIDFTPLI